jgi:N-acetylmuramoyl-L-alanine amidase CwlA
MRFVTIHETGNTRAGANARAHGNYLRGNDAAARPVSWHYTTDDSEIRQHLPENEDAFHAGDGAGAGNRQSIGIEICVNSDGNFAPAIDRTVELVADICRRRNIPIDNVVQHHRWCPRNKNCPQNIRAGRPINWNTFIQRVRERLGGASAPNPAPPPATATIRAGDTVRIASNATYWSGNAVPAWVRNQNWIVRSVQGDRAVIDRNAAGTNNINSPIHVRFLTRVSGSTPAPAATPATAPQPPRPNIDQIAREVIRGTWGNGAERVRRLTAAGHDAAAVQRRVNELLR